MAVQTSFRIGIVVLLLLLASTLAAASAWQPFRFHDGERYEYEFVWEHPDGTVDTGEFTIAAQHVGRSDLQVSVALLAAGEHYEVTAMNHAADYVYIVEDLYVEVGNTVPYDLALPFLLTLWEPWFYTPLDGMMLQEDMPLRRDEELELTIEVVGRKDVAGRSGLRLDLVFSSEGVDLEHFDMVVDPQLALPLSVSLTHLGGHLVLVDSVLTVRLVAYQADAAPRESRNNAAGPLGPEAADARWWPFVFQDGERYEYEFSVEYPEGAVETGAFVISAQDVDHRERLVLVELTVQKERYEGKAVTHAADVAYMFRDLYVAISNAAPPKLASVFFVTLWVPWFDSSLDGMVLDDAMPFFYDEEYGYTLEFGDRIEVAGRSGYRIDVRFLEDGVELAHLDMAVDPQLALPIYVAVSEMPENTAVPGAQVIVSLTEYRSDGIAP